MYCIPAISHVPTLGALRPRELQVLAHSADGASDFEIARSLRLQPRSVRRIWRDLLWKLGSTSRLSATAAFAVASARALDRFGLAHIAMTGSPGLYGDRSDCFVLSTSSGVILACGQGAAREFGLWPGLMLTDSPVQAKFSGMDGTSTPIWGDLVSSQFPKLIGEMPQARVILPCQDSPREFDLDVIEQVDPILGRIALLSFARVVTIAQIAKAS